MEDAEEEVEQQAAMLAQEGVEMDEDMAYALRLEKGLFTLQQVIIVGLFVDFIAFARSTTSSWNSTAPESSLFANALSLIYPCASHR